MQLCQQITKPQKGFPCFYAPLLHEDCDSDVEIKRRTEMDRISGTKYQKILSSREFSLSLRLLFMKWFLWSVLQVICFEVQFDLVIGSLFHTLKQYVFIPIRNDS